MTSEERKLIKDIRTAFDNENLTADILSRALNISFLEASHIMAVKILGPRRERIRHSPTTPEPQLHS